MKLFGITFTCEDQFLATMSMKGTLETKVIRGSNTSWLQRLKDKLRGIV